MYMVTSCFGTIMRPLCGLQCSKVPVLMTWETDQNWPDFGAPYWQAGFNDLSVLKKYFLTLFFLIWIFFITLKNHFCIYWIALFTICLGWYCTQQRSASLSESIDIYGPTLLIDCINESSLHSILKWTNLVKIIQKQKRQQS